ncbi:MAG: hypothetical protein ACTSXJ_10575 [Candidatus Baldrarchaeia archaeon]
MEEVSHTTDVFVIRNAVEIELIDLEEDRVLSRLDADLVIQDNVMEPLITDITINELGIQVISSFSKGLWRHREDPPDKVRRSSEVK